jgi:hypothetical protein
LANRRKLKAQLFEGLAGERRAAGTAMGRCRAINVTPKFTGAVGTRLSHFV